MVPPWLRDKCSLLVIASACRPHVHREVSAERTRSSSHSCVFPQEQPATAYRTGVYAPRAQHRDMLAAGIGNHRQGCQTCHKPSRFTSLRFCLYRTQMAPGHGPTHAHASPPSANAPPWAGVSDRMPSSARNRLRCASQGLKPSERQLRVARTAQCSPGVVVYDVVFFNQPNKNRMACQHLQLPLAARPTVFRAPAVAPPPLQPTMASMAPVRKVAVQDAASSCAG